MKSYELLLKQYYQFLHSIIELEALEFRLARALFTQTTQKRIKVKEEHFKLLDSIERFNTESRKILNHLSTIEGLISPAVEALLNAAKNVPQAQNLEPGLLSLLKHLDEQASRISKLKVSIEQALKNLESAPVLN